MFVYLFCYLILILMIFSLFFPLIFATPILSYPTFLTFCCFLLVNCFFGVWLLLVELIYMHIPFPFRQYYYEYMYIFMYIKHYLSYCYFLGLIAMLTWLLLLFCCHYYYWDLLLLKIVFIFYLLLKLQIQIILFGRSIN